MTLLWFLLVAVLVGALVFWRLVATAARWGREWMELRDHGRETTGTVVRKLEYRNRGGGHSRFIRYEYVDQFGARHKRKVMAMDEGWAVPEGGPIQIVYSERQPKISAPKYLLDTMESQARSRGVTLPRQE